jgi:uncharacterized repeat protein (TIGR01451 family)
MNDPKKGYVYRKLPVIVLLLLSLSLNAACSSPSESGASRTSNEEIGLQWNIFGGETDISSLIPSSDDLLLAYHPPCARIREPQNGMIFAANETGFAKIPVHITSSSESANIVAYEGDEIIGGPGPSPLSFDFIAEIGVHTITAKADDGCSCAPVTFIVNPSEPSVEITSPANGQVFSAPGEIEICANVQGPHEIEMVEFFANTQKLGENTTGSSYCFKWANPDPGVYRLTAKATDDLGHVAISNFVLVVVVPEKPLAKADLGLTMSCSPGPVLIGANLNYILTLTNFGPSRATDIILTDFLPAGLEYEYSTATQGTYEEAGEWDVGSIDPYRSVRLTIFTKVPSDMNPGRIHNEATVAGAQRDEDTSNNYAHKYTLLIRRT